MIVRHAEVVLVDAAKTTVPQRGLPIRRRGGDGGERAGGRAEGRGIGAGNGRHAEGDLGVAGRALAHDPGLRRPRRVLLALQHLDEVVGGPQGVARHQRALDTVVHRYGDPPDVAGLLEGRGSAVTPGGHPVAAHGVLVIGLDDLGGVDRLLGRLVLRRYHRQLRTRQVSALRVTSQYQTFVQSSENSERQLREQIGVTCRWLERCRSFRGFKKRERTNNRDREIRRKIQDVYKFKIQFLSYGFSLRKISQVYGIPKAHKN